jgi:hypothetical protein
VGQQLQYTRRIAGARFQTISIDGATLAAPRLGGRKGTRLSQSEIHFDLISAYTLPTY